MNVDLIDTPCSLGSSRTGPLVVQAHYKLSTSVYHQPNRMILRSLRLHW